MLAPGVRIELTIAESKSVVLPLHYPGITIGVPWEIWTPTSSFGDCRAAVDTKDT